MASDVDICNIALSNLGDAVQINSIAPADNTRQAELCARYYPLARDLMFTQDYNWSFSIKRANLVRLGVTDDVAGWKYAYALPNLAARVISIQAPSLPDETGAYAYSVERTTTGAPVLRADLLDAVLIYSEIVVDAARYDASFYLALARRLSAFLAGPIIKGSAGAKTSIEMLKIFRSEWAAAVEADANAGRVTAAYQNFLPGDLRART